MSNEQALLNCTFGWGKTCRLYYDSIEIAGKSYNLKDLTSIHPNYRIVFGVPSASLELSFGLERLILRGISDLSMARLMVSHLQPYCSTAPHTAHTRSRAARARHLARAQARAWERTNKLPAILSLSDEESPLSTCSAGSSIKDEAISGKSGFDEEPPTDQPLTIDAVPKAPIEDTSLTPGETLEAFAQLANNLSTYASPLNTARWQPPRTPRFHPPLHSVHLIHPHQKFDSNSMPVPVVRSSVLPIIHVPVRLQHGECAHYSIGATLCSDRIANSARATYPLLDNGLMILTNRRVLYVGKRCQFTLAYTHLWYVSLLHSAIALHIEGQFRRIIIELEHSQEWASRIELLSFIARRERPELPTLSVAAVPGLSMTAKRKAVKPSARKKQAALDNPTVPLLAERVVSKNIVDAETVELVNESSQNCADQQTQDIPVSVPLELVKSNTPRIGRQSDISQGPTQEFTLAEYQPDITQSETRELVLAEQCQPDISQSETQEFVLAEQCQPDISQSPTQEFVLSELQSTLEEIPTQAILHKAEIARLSTREFSLLVHPEGAEHAPPAYEREKTTQGLRLDQAEIVRLQEAQPGEPSGELMTGALEDIDLPLAELVHGVVPSTEIRTQDLDDDDDRTIHLHDRKLSQLRTVSLSPPAGDNVPESTKADQGRQHVRVPQRSS